MHTTQTLRGIACTSAGAAAIAGLLLAGGCAVDQSAGVTEPRGLSLAASASPVTNVPKVTGSIEIVSMGGKGEGAPEAEIRAFAEFEGFEMPAGMEPRGSFFFRVYRVTPEGLVLHREIEAAATDVVIDPVSHKAWMTAEVIADNKQCMSGGGCDGEDGGSDGGCTDCGGETGHDGGCSGSDGETHEDGGCGGGSGGTGGMDSGIGDMGGGCAVTDGTTTTDDGCSGGEDTSGGCSGGDDTSHDGVCAGRDSHVSGSGSRLGQILVVKMHDLGTPGTNGDGITWKWFATEDQAVATINGGEPKGLCKKTITGGNLLIHLPAN